MIKPLEICIEELHRATEDDSIIRCTALPGGEPGLHLDSEGLLRWMQDDCATYGLWVSADNQLILHRGKDAAPIFVERETRTVEAPPDKPVVLLHGDCLHCGTKTFRIHIHGEASDIREPQRLSRRTLAKFATAAAAAASITMGAWNIHAHANNATAIEVRLQPPKPAIPRRPLICTIEKQQVRAKGTIKIVARCPHHRGLYTGHVGNILSKDGTEVPQGEVVIKSITGNKITAEAKTIVKPVPGGKLRFMAY